MLRKEVFHRSDTDYLPCPRSLYLWVGSDAFRLLGGNILTGAMRIADVYKRQAMDENVKEKYGLEKTVVPVKGCRNISKKDMVLDVYKRQDIHLLYEQ